MIRKSSLYFYFAFCQFTQLHNFKFARSWAGLFALIDHFLRGNFVVNLWPLEEASWGVKQGFGAL